MVGGAANTVVEAKVRNAPVFIQDGILHSPHASNRKEIVQRMAT